MAQRPQPLVAGNWKMNGLGADLAEVEAIRDAVCRRAAGDAEVLVCPPTTLIREAARIAAGTPLRIGGQNCHKNDRGAHTGSISPAMLRDAGASYVILGHSERRADHNETNVAVRAKALAANAAGLRAIVCVGETKDERDAGRALAVVQRQLAGSVPAGCDPDWLVLAYEPIWAIGTGVTPTAADVARMHGFMREELVRMFPAAGTSVRLLYGGSVKPGNAAELMAIPNVDGALVGGASLKAADFVGIAAAYRAAVPAVG